MLLPATYSGNEKLKEGQSREDEEMRLYGFESFMKSPFQSVIRVTEESVKTNQRIRELYEATKVVASSLNNI